ncbi:hypothetical protein ACIOVC_05640 [Pseudomonas neuropathica]
MQVVVSCDYLISPAFCEPENLAEKVGDLIAIKREMENGGNRVILEAKSLEKLAELNYYPCAPLFNKNIPRELRGEFSAKDIAKVVHNIASMIVDEECLLPECAADWDVKDFDPELCGITHERLNALTQLVEDVFLAGHFHNRLYSILHHPLDQKTNFIKISGEITSSIPAFDTPPPLELEDRVKVFSAYGEFLSEFNFNDMYANARTPEQIHEAILLGASSLIQSAGVGAIRKFSLGDSFIESLDAHQCAPGQRYAGTAFDVISHVVASVPKYPHNPMYSDLEKKEQKTKQGFLAWRTQITKGNPALRLMYWSEGDDIVLANVGNKKELKIL